MLLTASAAMAQKQVIANEFPGLTRNAQGVVATANNGAQKVQTNADADDVLVTLPDDAVAEDWTIDGSVQYYTSSGWQTGNWPAAAKVAFVGNDVYIQGLSYTVPSAWLKGSIDGTNILVPSYQYMGTQGTNDFYFIAQDQDENNIDAAIFAYDANAGKLTQTNAWIQTSPDKAGQYLYSYASNTTLTKGAPETDEVVTPPAGLLTEEWTFTAKQLTFNSETNEQILTDVTFPVNVGFDGNNVYIQGLANADEFSTMSESWVMGSRNGSEINFETGQYLGALYGTYDFYVLGWIDGTGIVDYTMTMNDSENTMTTDEWVILNGKKNQLYYYAIYTEAKISKATTGIETIEAENAAKNTVTYNIAGQRVNGEYKGIVIENGKKIIR